jgi:hypothetical protein
MIIKFENKKHLNNGITKKKTFFLLDLHIFIILSL